MVYGMVYFPGHTDQIGVIIDRVIRLYTRVYMEMKMAPVCLNNYAFAD